MEPVFLVLDANKTTEGLVEAVMEAVAGRKDDGDCSLLAVRGAAVVARMDSVQDLRQNVCQP